MNNPYFDQAIAHHQAGRLAEAEAMYKQALAREPSNLDALHLLGVVAHQVGKYEIAHELIRRAVIANPSSAVYHNNLAATLKELGRLDEAVASYQKAIALEPRNPDGYTNLGTVLLATSRIDDAIAAHRKALEIYSGHPVAHYNLGLALLTRGDFKTGWDEYEWRWQVPGLPLMPREFAKPQWDGGELTGRRILLHAEQAFGDALQFARYVPLVAARRATVILECPDALGRLFQSIQGVSEVVATGKALPDFDVHCPLLSLPRLLGTTLATIPTNVPYVSAQPTGAERFKDAGDRLKVGLVWSGRCAPRNRSIPLDMLAQLNQIPGVWCCSLQSGAAAAEARSFRIPEWSGEIRDFADTASLMANLDLVVTIDTAAAHLAGAMGKPVWVMLIAMPDWRWMTERTDSPWYPTMRLFRQTRLGDWTGPMGDLTEALRAATLDRSLLCR